MINIETYKYSWLPFRSALLRVFSCFASYFLFAFSFKFQVWRRWFSSSFKQMEIFHSSEWMAEFEELHANWLNRFLFMTGLPISVVCFCFCYCSLMNQMNSYQMKRTIQDSGWIASFILSIVINWNNRNACRGLWKVFNVIYFHQRKEIRTCCEQTIAELVD